MSWSTSWAGFTKAASDLAKAASEKATEVAKEAADKSKVLASTVHDSVNKFVEEQKQEYSAVEQESDLTRRKAAKKDQMMQSGHAPWWIHPDTNAQQLQLYDELKVNILKLCEDENNFLIKAPSSTSVFDFNLQYALPHAHRALDDDPILPQIRFKLVPRKLAEEQFWKNYFYRVNVIRESLGIDKMDFGKAPAPTPSPSTPRTPSTNTQNTLKSSNTEEDKANTMDTEHKDDTEVVEDAKEDISETSHSRSKSKEMIETTKTDELSDNANAIKMDLSNSMKHIPSSEQITQMETQNVDIDDDDFLADDVHIDTLSDVEKAKMMKDLGIQGNDDIENDDDIENVDDLLAEVGADDIEDMSDGALEAELENM